MKNRNEWEAEAIKRLHIARVILANTPGEHFFRDLMHDFSEVIESVYHPTISEIEALNNSDELRTIKTMLNL